AQEGRRDRLALERRNALAVPPRVDLTDGVGEGLRESHASGEPARDLAVAWKKARRDTGELAEAAKNGLRDANRTAASRHPADRAQNEPEHRLRVGGIELDELGAECEFIPEDGRGPVRIGVAPDVPEQRLVIHVVQRRRVEPERLTQADSDQTC